MMAKNLIVFKTVLAKLLLACRLTMCMNKEGNIRLKKSLTDPLNLENEIFVECHLIRRKETEDYKRIN